MNLRRENGTTACVFQKSLNDEKNVYAVYIFCNCSGSSGLNYLTVKLIVWEYITESMYF